jgi:hypothetical protein
MPGAFDVPMLQIGMAVGTGGAITIDEITLHGSGTGDESTGVIWVKLWDDVDKDGVITAVDRQIGTSQQFTVNDGSVTFTGLGENLGSGAVLAWLVTYDFNPSAVQGETFRVELNAAGDMTVYDQAWGPSASIVPMGAPVQGGMKAISTMGAGDIQVFLGGMNPATAVALPGSQNVTVLQLNLVSSSLESVDITALRVWAVGTGFDDVDITAATLVHDANGNGAFDATETVLGTGTFGNDNGTLTFTFPSPVTVTPGASEKFLLLYNFRLGIAGRWDFAAGILTGGDVSTTGVTSGSPVPVTGPPLLGEYTTIDTPPAPEATYTPDYSMGCAGSAAGANFVAWILPWMILAGTLVWIRRRSAVRA